MYSFDIMKYFLVAVFSFAIILPQCTSDNINAFDKYLQSDIWYAERTSQFGLNERLFVEFGADHAFSIYYADTTYRKITGDYISNAGNYRVTLSPKILYTRNMSPRSIACFDSSCIDTCRVLKEYEETSILGAISLGPNKSLFFSDTIFFHVYVKPDTSGTPLDSI